MTGFKFLKYLLAILPTIITFFILIKFFPYTGLGRIVALPTIFIANSVLIFLGFKWTRNVNLATNMMVWIGIIILTLVIATVFYPQESAPNVIIQIIEKIVNKK